MACAGADPTARTLGGHTPLHVAVFRGSTAAARMLLERRPSLAAEQDARGRSAADVACLHAPGLATAEPPATASWLRGVVSALQDSGWDGACRPPPSTVEAATATVIAAVEAEAAADEDPTSWLGRGWAELTARAQPVPLPPGVKADQVPPNAHNHNATTPSAYVAT